MVLPDLGACAEAARTGVADAVITHRRIRDKSNCMLTAVRCPEGQDRAALQGLRWFQAD
jgi:hypothetical protein